MVSPDFPLESDNGGQALEVEETEPPCNLTANWAESRVPIMLTPRPDEGAAMDGGVLPCVRPLLTFRRPS